MSLLKVRIKEWYRRRKKRTRAILKGIMDGMFFITAFSLAIAIGYLLVVIINLIGIPYDGG